MAECYSLSLHLLMHSKLLSYSSGQDVQLRDRVEYRGVFATVVFVTDGEDSEWSPGYEGYSGYDRGLVVRDDDGTLTSVQETDEQLVLARRAPTDT
jgi:hypothetical protein